MDQPPLTYLQKLREHSKCMRQLAREQRLLSAAKLQHMRARILILKADGIARAQKENRAQGTEGGPLEQ